MNTDEEIQAAIDNAGDIGCTFVPDITESEYRSMLISIDALMDRDPDPTTPDGIWLSELVRIVEQYESKHYPSLSLSHIELLKTSNSDVRRIALERDRMRHALQKIEAESHDARAVDYAEAALR